MKFKQRRNTSQFSVIGNRDTRKKSPELEIGKVYYTYDDGKVRLSRIGRFKIVEAIDLDRDFDKLDPDWQSALKYEILESYWLFRQTQHIIYRGIDLDEQEDQYGRLFLATKDGGWFSTGCFGGGELDVNNSITKGMLLGYKESLEQNMEQDKEWCEMIKRRLKCYFGNDNIDIIMEDL